MKGSVKARHVKALQAHAIRARVVEVKPSKLSRAY